MESSNTECEIVSPEKGTKVNVNWNTHSTDKPARKRLIRKDTPLTLNVPQDSKKKGFTPKLSGSIEETVAE